MNGSPRPGVIERYQEFLPVGEATPNLTIGEGRWFGRRHWNAGSGWRRSG